HRDGLRRCLLRDLYPEPLRYGLDKFHDHRAGGSIAAFRNELDCSRHFLAECDSDSVVSGLGRVVSGAAPTESKDFQTCKPTFDRTDVLTLCLGDLSNRAQHRASRYRQFDWKRFK